MSELAFQEEGVGVHHAVDRPWGGEWHQARWDLLQQRRSGQECGLEPRRELRFVARVGARSGVNGRHRRPPHLTKHCLVDKIELARQAVGCLRGEAVYASPMSRKKSAKPWKAECARSVASTPLKSST